MAAIKLTATMVDVICKSVEDGAWLFQIAAEVGIGERTLRRYRDRGRDALEKQSEGEELDQEEQLLASFYRRFTLAERRAQADALTEIKSKAKNHLGQAWWLERRWPKQFGRGDRLAIEHSGRVDGDGKAAAVIVLPSNGREAPPPEGDGDNAVTAH